MAKSKRANPARLLAKVIRITSSRVRAEKKLQNILRTVSREMDLGEGFIFFLDRQHEYLTLRIAGNRLEDWPYPTTYRLGEGLVGTSCFCGRILKEARIGSAGEAPSSPPRRIAVFPISDDRFLYGAMAFYLEDRPSLSESKVGLLQSIGLEVGWIIRSAQLNMEGKRRTMELNALFEVGKVISSTMDLEPLAHELVAICARLVGARSARLTIHNIREQQNVAHVRFGPEPPSHLVPLAVHLSLGEAFSGELAVFDKIFEGEGKPSEFDEEDRRLLNTVSSFISSALQKSIFLKKMESLARKNEQMVRALQTLYEISGAMITTRDSEEILNLFLNAVIHAEGLEFDRVFVLLPDREHNQWSLYRRISRPHPPSCDWNGPDAFLLNWGRQWKDPVAIPYGEEPGILGRCLKERQAFNITDPSRPGWVPSETLLSVFRHPCAVAPLLTQNKIIGIVVADHAQKNRVVEESELNILSMLANQAGLALENSRLIRSIELANRELQTTRERLIQTEKLAALGEIAGGIAHEIRNPLVAIGGFARRVQKKVAGDPTLRNYLEVIVSQVERLEKTLTDVLRFSADSSGDFQYFELNSVILEALDFLKLELADSGVRVERELRDLPPILGDHKQVRHLFYNLFLNAIQAMGKGGLLIVRTYPSAYDGRPFVVAVVEDRGGGIPTEILHNIFNPFFTTKSEGSGLGLAIVHRIVTRHNGEIDVRNVPGTGVAFTIKFPAYPVES